MGYFKSTHAVETPCPPRKMALRDAQLIEKLFFGQYSIGNLTCGTMKSYEPARGRGRYDAICTRLLWSAGTRGIG